MTGVIVGALIVAAAWAYFEWDQRRIERDADIDVDDTWEAFFDGEWRVR